MIAMPFERIVTADHLNGYLVNAHCRSVDAAPGLFCGGIICYLTGRHRYHLFYPLHHYTVVEGGVMSLHSLRSLTKNGAYFNLELIGDNTMKQLLLFDGALNIRFYELVDIADIVIRL